MSEEEVVTQRHLTVCAETWNPWMRIKEGEDGEMNYSGIMFNVLEFLAEAMNFTYTMVRPPDGLWGVGFPNGSWNGQLGMVKRREVDLALGPFAFNWERHHFACEFTQPVFIDYESVFVRRQRIESDLAGLIKPYTWQTWVCIGVIIPVMWTVLTLLNRWSLTEYYSKNEAQTRMGFSDSYLMWIIRTLTMQSNPRLPRSDSLRVVTGSWLIATIVIISLFSGTLTAMLTVPFVKVPIDSTTDLVEQNEIPWAVESGSFLYQILYLATSGIYKQIWDGHTHLITDCYSFRHDIRDGKYAAVCDKLTMKKVMSEDFSSSGECNYYMASEDFKSMPLALGFQHQHPLYAEANQQVLYMVATGLIDRWIQQETPNGTACLGNVESNLMQLLRPLSLPDYYGLFSLYAVCVVGTCITLFLEMAAFKFRNSENKRNPTTKTTIFE
ncbi:unnamed protein product, partial [Meganyctiphanes norvegica]